MPPSRGTPPEPTPASTMCSSATPGLATLPQPGLTPNSVWPRIPDCYDPGSRAMNILWFLPILSVMMFVHELGHFITARLSGITVQEFGFGLPPRIWGYKARNGVIYSINWIPFGAFVKMLGEEDPSAPGSFASKPRGIRALVLIAGSAMNFFLAVAAFAMVFIVGVPGVPPDGTVTIAQVADSSPAQDAG